MIRTDAANVASAAVARKIGFIIEGREQRPIETPGHTGHGLVWVMTRDQWASASGTWLEVR